MALPDACELPGCGAALLVRAAAGAAGTDGRFFHWHRGRRRHHGADGAARRVADVRRRTEIPVLLRACHPAWFDAIGGPTACGLGHVGPRRRALSARRAGADGGMAPAPGAHGLMP